MKNKNELKVPSFANKANTEYKEQRKELTIKYFVNTLILLFLCLIVYGIYLQN